MLSMFMIEFFPSPTVALILFGFSVHWYGLMYFAAFLLAFFLLPRLQKYRSLSLTQDDWATLLSWAIVGVLVGGRLGFVLFYEPSYFLHHPLEIAAVWNGGMSSHGGFIGVVLALAYAGKKKGIDLLALADTVVVPAAIGLALGRIGNFINGELYGTVTNLPWVVATDGLEGLRHPAQMYAVLKDLFLAWVCLRHLIIPGSLRGRTFALFLALYGALRFVVEYFREQPYGFIDLKIVSLSVGQLLTIPIIIVGVWLWWKLGNARRADHVQNPDVL
ncbi:MAG: prolipoprotein diacylglyceryl transferase [Candidatus Peribacteraceae bacterium]|nr:prolipoprotein diacylglyceryl transferase [Candidatus Peribacteraceae bacterium]